MSDSRERFERWAMECEYRLNVRACEDGWMNGEYLSVDTRLAHAAWQSRDAEIAECQRMNRELVALVQRDTDALAEALKEIARLREAVSDFLCECALEFSDERLSYETWQITAGAVDELRRALEEKS